RSILAEMLRAQNRCATAPRRALDLDARALDLRLSCARAVEQAHAVSVLLAPHRGDADAERAGNRPCKVTPYRALSEIAGAELDAGLERIPRIAGDDFDSAAGRVPSVEGTLRTAQNFDALDAEQIERSSEGASDVHVVDIDSDALIDRRDVIELPDAANEELRGGRAAERRGRDLEVRHGTAQLVDGPNRVPGEGLGVESRNRRRHALKTFFLLARGVDDFLQSAAFRRFGAHGQRNSAGEQRGGEGSKNPKGSIDSALRVHALTRNGRNGRAQHATQVGRALLGKTVESPGGAVGPALAPVEHQDGAT